MRNQSSLGGPNGNDWEAASRPSKTNPPESGSGLNAPDSEGQLEPRRRYWKRKNEIVENFIETFPDRASRPVSVRDNGKLRKEAGTELLGDGYSSKSWSAVLREFLGWYNGYRWSHLLYRDPEEKLVRAPLKNSHQPAYGNIYYAKLKALERRVISEFDNPHVVMLTLTGSMKQGVERPHGRGWRCPADHLREIVEPFGNSVRKALHRELDVDRWEYAKVLEHHKNGYGHMHVAVFVDGNVTEADFRPAIDAHLRNCDIAGADAHDYHDPDPDKRPISLNRVDPDARLKQRRAQGMLWLDDEPVDANSTELKEFGVGNVASYIAEYIGSYGEELFERDLKELGFRAVCWATSTQRVTFSPGANDLIDAERPTSDAPEDEFEVAARWKTGTTETKLKQANDDPDQAPSDYLEDRDKSWTLEGLGTVDLHGEDRHKLENSAVEYIIVENAEHLDPPNPQPPDRPQPRTTNSGLTDY